MDICERDHEKIVFDGCFCPLCEAEKEIINLEERIEELEDEIDEIRELEGEQK